MQTITVDMTPGFRQPTIHYSQNDVGTTFAIDLRSRFGDTLPASPTVKIQATKPSGFGFSIEADSVVDSVATFTTVATMTDEAGRFQAELEISEDSVVLYTANFYMEGEANPHPIGTTDGSQETIIPTLTLLVERVEAAAASVLDMTVNATTLAAGSQATYSYDEDTNTATFGIPQGEAGAGAAGVTASAYSSSSTYAVGDYVIHNSNLYRCTTAITTAEAFTAAHWTQVVLGDDVSDLKSELNKADDAINYMLGESIKGYLEWIIGRGIGADGADYHTSVAACTDMTINKFSNYYYRLPPFADSNNILLSVWVHEYDSDRTWLRRTALNQSNPMLAVGNDCEFIRISFNRPSASGVTMTQADVDEYFDLFALVSPYEHFELNEKYNNLWSVGNILKGYALDASTGEVQILDGYSTTDFIPVTEGDLLYGNHGARYFFYDSDKTPVSSGNLSQANELIVGSGIKYIIAPSDVSYFRLCSSYSDNYLMRRNPYERYLDEKNNVSESRKLYCIGDSITRGMYTDIGDAASKGPTQYGYPYWIGRINGYAIVNLGESGGGYAFKGTQSNQNCKDIVDNNSFSDADIITIAFGVNDWKGASQNIVLGSMASTSGDGTVIGNMKYAIETLVTKKPTAQIIVLLPMNQNRVFTGMDADGMTLANNWAFGYAYRNGQTLEDYRDAIRECAEYYNVKVVDLEEITPLNRLNIRTMLGDGLHPTLAFYKQMGQALAPLIH